MVKKMKTSKLKNCKVCGAEVAKSAKSCPHCGAKLKKGHPILIGILVLFVFSAIVSASGEDDEPKKVEVTAPTQNAEIAPNQNKNTTPEPSKEKKDAFYVGETAELKGVYVTLASVTESTGSAYNTPTDGNVFVLCEFEIANDSNTEITVSSMLSFEAYCDDYTCTYSLAAILEKDNKNQLDGTVAPGKKFNGVVGYEVPADWNELEIVFTPDFWTGKDITFIASNQ